MGPVEGHLKRINYGAISGFDEEESHAVLQHNIGVLVRNNCSADNASWKMVPDDVKKYMVLELYVSSN